MPTREEIDQIIHHCQETGQTYKEHLIELGIPAWKFLQLNSSNASQISEFFGNGQKSKSSRKISRKEDRTTLVNVEMKTASGNLIRIQGEFTSRTLQDIILASSGYVQP